MPITLTDEQTPEVALKYLDSLLDGFETVPSDSAPFITLDKQRRFYLNASLRKLIDVKSYDRVSIAYNPETRSLAILTGESAEAIPASSYFVDKRYYMSARRFCAEYRYTPDSAPYTFEFQRAGSVAGVYLFTLAADPLT